MTRRAKIWTVIAVLFAVLNAGGAAFALLDGEPLHAAVHVALLAAAYPAWRLVTRRRQVGLAHAQPIDTRLEHLQQSLDAIAIDVERIGEAQRYAVKVLVEREGTSPPKAE